MTARPAAESVLRRVGEGPADGIDLARVALALASLDRGEPKLDYYFDHLDLLAGTVARAAAGARSLDDRLAALNEALYVIYLYQGDRRTYDDLQNANLMRVIDRRRGLPVALGILCIHAARAQGWPAFGLRFPGHFLVRIEGDGQRAIVDPFDRGTRCDAAGLRRLLQSQEDETAVLRPVHYEAASDREVLLRLQNNIKQRQTRQGDTQAAATTIESMLWMAPDEAALWREKALLDAQTGRIDRAVDALVEYIARETQDGPRHEAAVLLQRLRNPAG